MNPEMSRSFPFLPPFTQENFPLYQRNEGNEGWISEVTELLLKNPYIQVEETTYRTPHQPNKEVSWTVSRRKNAVVVAPRLQDGRYLMIRQERYPIERALWEFPAGQIDAPPEEITREVILETVRRELEEETQYQIDPHVPDLLPLGYFFSSQGFTDEHAYLFLAPSVIPMSSSSQPLGLGNESILEVRLFTAEDLKNMVVSNELVDANSLVLLSRLLAMGIL